MKAIFFILVALTTTTPSLADSGDVPENFEEAILRESADDQGVQADLRKGKRPKQPEIRTDLTEDARVPEGFEEAILGESADDQGIDTRKHNKKASAAAAKKGKSKNKNATAKRESDEDFLRRMVMINEIFGEYPSTEEECRKTTDDPAHFQTCMEMGPAVLSSNNERAPAKLKKEIHRGGDSDDHKASIVFEAN